MTGTRWDAASGLRRRKPNNFRAEYGRHWRGSAGAFAELTFLWKLTIKMSESRYTTEQRAWCKTYRCETGFAPMMDQFERGEETFREAATRSIRWYEAHTSDVHLRIQKALPSLDH